MIASTERYGTDGKMSTRVLRSMVVDGGVAHAYWVEGEQMFREERNKKKIAAEEKKLLRLKKKEEDKEGSEGEGESESDSSSEGDNL